MATHPLPGEMNTPLTPPDPGAPVFGPGDNSDSGSDMMGIPSGDDGEPGTAAELGMPGEDRGRPRLSRDRHAATQAPAGSETDVEREFAARDGALPEDENESPDLGFIVQVRDGQSMKPGSSAPSRSRQGQVQVQAQGPALGTLVLCVVLSACGDNNSPSNVTSPGDDAQTKTKILETGAALLQAKRPLEALNVYMNGFHFYNGDMKGQMEAHHYCSVVNEDINQCVIFDGNGADAKIMGVEYILSRKLFDTLDGNERKLWHSHVHEVKSGQLVAPGIPQKAEHEFMEKMIGTYGKTWHTWHTDQKLSLPLGHPLLMMGFTDAGQMDAAMVAKRDSRMGISSAQKRKDREGIPAPSIVPGADAWQQGDVQQLSLQQLDKDAPVPHGHSNREAPARN